MRNRRKFRRWALRISIAAATVLPGCLGALQSGLDTALSPSAAGNLLSAPYSMVSGIVRFFARLG